MNLNSFGLSFKGRRANNEDAFLDLNITDDLYLAAVADGMGGTVAGEVASNIIITGLADYFGNNTPELMTQSDLKSLLMDAVEYSREKFNERLAGDSSLAGMGTTLTAILLWKNKFVCCNIGDSRLYRMNESTVELLSKDHSYIQQHLDEHGEISDDVAQQFSNYLTRVIDGGSDECDFFPETADCYTLAEGDILLLCSDGLIFDKASEDYSLLHNYVRGTRSIKKAVVDLISHHYHNGSDDNITVILLENGRMKRKKFQELKHYIYPPDKKGTIIINTVKKISHRYLIAIFVVLIILVISLILLFRGTGGSRDENPGRPATENLQDAGDTEITADNANGSTSRVQPSETGPGKVHEDIEVKEPVTGPVFHPELNWEPFSNIDATIPLTKQSTIVWDPYPDINELLHYQMAVWNDSISIFNENISKSIKSLSIEHIIKSYPSNIYWMKIDAQLKSGKLISGDTITVKINNQI